MIEFRSQVTPHFLILRHDKIFSAFRIDLNSAETLETRLGVFSHFRPKIPDQFRHEIATAYNLRGKGLVVLTSCSHRGVVNIVKQAQAASGVTRVHAVLGGFHLAPFKEDYVRQAVAGLKALAEKP